MLPLESDASRLRARVQAHRTATPCLRPASVWDCIVAGLAQAVTIALLHAALSARPCLDASQVAARLRGAFTLASPRPPNQRPGVSPVSLSQRMQATVRSQDEPSIPGQSVPPTQREHLALARPRPSNGTSPAAHQALSLRDPRPGTQCLLHRGRPWYGVAPSGPTRSICSWVSIVMSDD